MTKLLYGKLLFVIFALYSQVAMAISYVDGQFPDELSSTGLPDALPCTMVNPNYGMRLPEGETKILRCTWASNFREIEEWNAQQGRLVKYFNQERGICRKGICQINGQRRGNLNRDLTFAMSIWYYMGVSTDGKPIAYKHGAGPVFQQPAISYAQAGEALVNFWEMAGVSQKIIQGSLGQHYDGGWEQFQADLAGGQPAPQVASFGEIKEAWCNPRMDDDCSINGNPVPKADLPKYLPLLDPTVVEAAGGSCEYPICYNSNYKPIGVSKNSYK